MSNLLLPTQASRPAMFKNRCWVCGFPTHQLFCVAHTDLALPEKQATGPGRPPTQGRGQGQEVHSK